MVNKERIINRVCRHTGYSRRVCAMIINEFIDVTDDYIINGNDVRIKNLFTIRIKEVDDHVGRDPVTGEVRKFDPYRVIKCTLSPTVKNAFKEKEKANEG